MISHSKPSITNEETRAIASVFRTGQLGYDNEEVNLFEKEFAKFIGVKYAIATISGTAAIHLAAIALGIKSKDRIVLPTYCCSAVLNAVLYLSARPILSDIEPETYNISPSYVKKLLKNKKVSAIIVPHMFGHPADIYEIKKNGIPIIEDCAMSIGGTCNEKKLGSIGKVGVTSFYATKVISTGGGGMVFTNCKDIKDRIADLIHYDKRSTYKIRYNYGMPAILAAVGRVQLRKLPSFLDRRKEIANFYLKELRGLPCKLPINKMGEHIFYRFVIDIGENNVEKFIKFMKSKNQECKRPVYMPLHKYFSGTKGKYPTADKVHKSCVSIPIYPSLTIKEAKLVAKSIKSFFNHVL